MYLLVYVDDFILTGNQESMITSFIDRLHNEFSIKDLGDLNYFLRLEVAYTNDGLFLCVSQYARDILDRVDLLDAKLIHTSLAPHESFTTLVFLSKILHFTGLLWGPFNI